MTGRLPLPFADALGLSGLSRGQIGRLFGLDYRTVASWLRSGNIPARYQVQADRVCRVITDALDRTGDTTARLVLLNSSQGRSLYHQLLDHAPTDQVIQVPAHTPTEMVS